MPKLSTMVLMYRPVPPARIGTLPRPAISLILFSARRLYSPAVSGLSGVRKAIKWCATPFATYTLLPFCLLPFSPSAFFHSPAMISDPISVPRYNCLESAEMISPPNFLAMAIARSVFPEAVGPTTAMSLGLEGRVRAFGGIGVDGDGRGHRIAVEIEEGLVFRTVGAVAVIDVSGQAERLAVDL